MTREDDNPEFKATGMPYVIIPDAEGKLVVAPVVGWWSDGSYTHLGGDINRARIPYWHPVVFSDGTAVPLMDAPKGFWSDESGARAHLREIERTYAEARKLDPWLPANPPVA